MTEIPRTRLARVGVVGSTAVRMGAARLKTKVKRPFLSDEARQLETGKQQDAEAELWFKAVTQLRGTAAKIAQMLGMEADLLPERVHQELSKSFHQMPPLNRVLVRKVIEQELGSAPDELFDNFDFNAIAAASLGQVHTAELADDKAVAVKVQYPGIHVTIDSDLKLLRSLLATGSKLVTKHPLPNRSIVDVSVKEIETRLREEIDYQNEADNTRWFKQHLVVDGVEVPNVYSAYSTRRVLTTDLLRGHHLDAWLATDPPQQVRNKAAQLIYDTFVFSAMNLGCVHADPNPGNYLFKENGEVAMIDFGCVKRLSDRFTNNLPQLLRAFYLNDYQSIVEAYDNIGMKMADNLEDYERILKPFGEWLSRPVRHDFFDFSENSDYTHSGLKLIRGLSEIPSFEAVEKDFIFFDRTLYGLFKIFEKLQAKVRMRGHWEQRW